MMQAYKIKWETVLYLNTNDVRGGEGGMNWESCIDRYTLPCVKYLASGKLWYSTGSSARCCVMTERAGTRGWEGGSRCVYTADPGFPDGWAIRNPPAVLEMQIRSLGQEVSLEKEMVTLAWEIPWTEEPGGLVHGVAKESDTT